MKVIAINGSPRRNWNTAKLCQAALDGAASAGSETELVHLESLTFKGCMPGLYSLLRRKDGDAVWLFYNDSTTELLGEILLDCSVPGHIMDLWIGEDTDAFGTLQENRLTLRLPPRTTCAVLMDGVVSQKQSIGVRQMWIPDKWNLMLTMLLPGSVANTSCLETVQRKMDQIASWSCLPGLEYTSGIGEYSTAFEIERVPVSATLLLDGVTDTFDVRVNGHSVPCNQAIRSAEIGSYLSAGQNELRIRVSSPLYNQLLEVQPERYGTITLPDGGTAVIPRQFYGIDSARLLICFPK